MKEEAVATEETSMIGPEATQLLASTRGGAIPGAVRDAIRKAMQLRQQVADLDRQIADRDRQLGQIAQEQARIREDMKTVASTTPYYARLLAKLNDQESAIERLQQERDELTRRRADKQRELDDYVNGVDVG